MSFLRHHRTRFCELLNETTRPLREANGRELEQAEPQGEETARSAA